ncbi:hypothetical protein FA09DRAFT_75247 [Tilletiopsis washingtonensis]|uniref:Uncharacterized protein n=1 Tax=Tilletiopsis washingtonensis TaxID=58919 RepID=A0A316Z7N3_9BASI|nr:hypothetical protein FA09DRAFT_75247 [Tilletiopsis washingtonensis]PWN96988.1 hypothetical protein FA09DRAFT_75247 [Tilletiopsis washingtonensis]
MPSSASSHGAPPSSAFSRPRCHLLAEPAGRPDSPLHAARSAAAQRLPMWVLLLRTAAQRLRRIRRGGGNATRTEYRSRLDAICSLRRRLLLCHPAYHSQLHLWLHPLAVAAGGWLLAVNVAQTQHATLRVEREPLGCWREPLHLEAGPGRVMCVVPAFCARLQE